MSVYSYIFQAKQARFRAKLMVRGYKGIYRQSRCMFRKVGLVQDLKNTYVCFPLWWISYNPKLFPSRFKVSRKGR